MQWKKLWWCIVLQEVETIGPLQKVESEHKKKKKLFEQNPHLPYQAWQYIAEQLMHAENKEPYMETDKKKKKRTWMIVQKCSRIVLTSYCFNEYNLLVVYSNPQK